MNDDEDGLMLNFAPASISTANGGGAARTANSRARRKEHIANNRAQRHQQQKQQQTSQPAPSQQEPARLQTSPSRTASRAQPSSSTQPQVRSAPTSTSATAAPAKRQRIEAARVRPSNGPARVPAGGVVSSLFPSYGPIGGADAGASTATPKRDHAPTNAPSTSSDFASLGLDPLLVCHLATKMNIGTRPTSIQKLALPPLLSSDASRDVFIQAQTGSGKTLTYLLPIVQSLLPLCQESFIDRSVGTLAVILAPTRELARQIYEVLEKLVSLALTLKQQQEAGEPSSSSNQPRDDGHDGDDDDDDDGQHPFVRRTRWLVPGLLSGGSTRNHEKQRLRKGCPILVSTPGRLLDHLQNTSSFEVGKCRWLILDEADRLLEMGFEDQLNGIIKALDGRRRLACVAAREAMPAYDADMQPGTDDWIRDDEVTDSMGIAWWSHRRRVVLCSATLDENVQVLAGNTLQHPLVLRGGKDEPLPVSTSDSTGDATSPAAPGAGNDGGGQASGAGGSNSTDATKHHFSAPAQLEQNYVVTPPKLRLVTLLAVLRSYLSRTKKSLKFGNDASAAATTGGAGRIIVFMSCTDSVDFHWSALGGARMSSYGEVPEVDASSSEDDADDDDDDEADGKGRGGGKGGKAKANGRRKKEAPIQQTSELIPDVPIFKLHGSMSQAERIASLRAFSRSGDAATDSGAAAAARSEAGTKGAILLCTSVASRGLDLPQVGCVVQLDPPTEGGIEEYLHRVGRTARVGKRGEAWLLVQPQEEGWVHAVLEAHMVLNAPAPAPVSAARSTPTQGGRKIAPSALEPLLQSGFGGASGTLEYQSRATDAQLAFERWVLAGAEPAELARRAYLSHVRAYATHPAEEKAWFNVRALHLGHLAKAFALREAPKSLGAKSKSQTSTAPAPAAATAAQKRKRTSAQQEAASTSGASTSAAKDAFELDATALRSLASSAAHRGLSDEIRDAQRKLRGRGAEGETDAESRMYAKVRALGKMSRRNGVLAAHGADEFQIA